MRCLTVCNTEGTLYLLMPTLKHRINLTVPDHLDRVLQQLAARDALSVATKTLSLLQRAIEMEEDDALFAIAEERERKPARFVSHKKAWKNYSS